MYYFENVYNLYLFDISCYQKGEESAYLLRSLLFSLTLALMYFYIKPYSTYHIPSITAPRLPNLTFVLLLHVQINIQMFPKNPTPLPSQKFFFFLIIVFWAARVHCLALTLGTVHKIFLYILYIQNIL